MAAQDYEEIQGLLTGLIIRLGDRLSLQQQDWGQEFIDHNELGLALESIADWLSEDELAISESERSDMLALVERMGMDQRVERALALCPTLSAAPAPDEVPASVVARRMRNRLMDYLEIASSFEEQQRYDREVSIVHVPYEILNQWGDWVPSGVSRLSTAVFTNDEIAALHCYEQVLDAAAKAMPDDFPRLAEVQRSTYWSHLAEAAAETLAVLNVRGRLLDE